MTAEAVLQHNNIKETALWEGINRKRNPYRKKVNPTLIDNFNENRVEHYAILCRVSSDMQAKEGESLESQLEKARRLVEKKGGYIYKEYIEEGVSVSKNKKLIDERPAMQEIKQAILEGKVNHILVFKRTRISRNKKDREKFLFEFCAEHGVKVTITQTGQEIDIMKKDKMTTIQEDMYGTFDEWYSDEVSENVTDVMWELARHQGRIMGGNAPIGYKTVYLDKRDEDNGKPIPTWQPVEEFQPIREYIEELYLTGYGYSSIARHLNGGEVKGLETPLTPYEKPSNNDKVGKNWNDKNIDTILFNPTYTGYYSYNIYRHEELYDPVIVKSQYIKACRTEERQKELNEMRKKKQKVINETKNTKRFSSPHLLSGIIVCKHCGQPYEVSGTKSSDPKKKTHHYYRCRNKFSSNKHRCTGATFNTKILDSFVIQRVDKIINGLIKSGDYEVVEKQLEEKQEDTQSAYNKISDQVKEKEEEVKAIIFEKMKLDKTDPMYDFTYEIYQQNEKKLISELAELKSALANVQNATEDTKSEQRNLQQILNVFKDYSEKFKYGSEQKRKAIIEYLISDVIVDEKMRVHIVFNFDIKPVKNNGGNIIGSENIGEGIFLDSMIDTIEGNVFIFNYQEEISRVLNKVSNAFYNFLCYKEPLFVPQTYSELPMSLRSGLYDELELPPNTPYSKKATIASNKKLMTTLGISSPSQRQRLQNGVLPSVDKLFEYIGKVNSNYNEFKEYVNSRHTGLLFDEETLYDIIESGRSKTGKKDYKFEDMIMCECGKKYVGMNKTGKKAQYRCINNRVDKGENRCISKIISEDDMLKEVSQKTEIENVRRQDIVWKVDNIIVDKDGKFKIAYK